MGEIRETVPLWYGFSCVTISYAYFLQKVSPTHKTSSVRSKKLHDRRRYGERQLLLILGIGEIFAFLRI